MLMTINNRGSGLSTCLFKNDVADAELRARKRDGIPAIRHRRSSPKSTGIHTATNRSLQWLKIMLLGPQQCIGMFQIIISWPWIFLSGDFGAT